MFPSHDRGGADTILKVVGTTTASRLDLQTDSHHRFLQTIESDGRFRLYNQTTSSEQLTVLSDGKVGINTTSPDSYSFGGQIFNVSAGSSYSNILITQNGTNVGGVQFGNGTIRRASIEDINGSGIKFSTNTTNSGTSISEQMRISASGDVGINLTSPSAKLDIEGGTALLMTRTSSGLAMYNEVDSNYSNLYLYETGGSAKVVFKTNATSYFNGGNVAIGSATADTKLTVCGTGDGERGFRIALIAVDPQCVREGVGKALVRCAIEEVGDQTLYAGTQLSNKAAIRLYQSCGMKLAEARYVLHYHKR